MLVIENSKQWQTEAAETSVLPPQQEIIHLCWEIERSNWFHFKKGDHIWVGQWIFPVAWCSRLFFSSTRSVCLTERASLEKHCYWMSHWRTLSQLIPALLYHVFCPHMTSFICQYVQWKAHNISLSESIRFHSPFSFISIVLPPDWLPSSHGVIGQRGKQYSISYQSEWCGCSQLIKRQTIECKWKG